MVWGISNVWITYAMYQGYRTVPMRSDLDIFERSTRDSGKLYKIYLEELKEHFPKHFEENAMLGASLNQESFEQYNLRYLRYMRIFSWNSDLRAALWDTYKYSVMIPYRKNKLLRKLAKECNRTMRREPDFIRYVFSKADITKYKVV